MVEREVVVVAVVDWESVRIRGVLGIGTLPSPGVPGSAEGVEACGVPLGVCPSSLGADAGSSAGVSGAASCLS